MKYQKPLVAAAVVTGLVVGGAGVAAAGDGERNRDVEETEAGLQEVQLENEDNDGADGDQDGERNGRNGRRSARLATVAEVIGIEGEDLRAELQDGATVAEVAEANGVAADDVVAALIANVEERLDERIAEGDITEEEAAERLENKTERISNRVNGIDNDEEDYNDVDAEADGDAEEVEA